jgi:hypothetical protein
VVADSTSERSEQANPSRRAYCARVHR